MLLIEQVFLVGITSLLFQKLFSIIFREVKLPISPAILKAKTYMKLNFFHLSFLEILD